MLIGSLSEGARETQGSVHRFINGGSEREGMSSKKSGEKKNSILSSIKDMVFDLFNKNIPSDEVQSMHESWRIPVAAIIYSALIAIFIAFLVTGTCLLLIYSLVYTLLTHFIHKDIINILTLDH